MYITYFDEVKYDPKQGQDSYWVGGLMVPMDKIGLIEADLNAISERLFGTVELKPETEFHCKLIYRGKGPYSGMSISDRIDLIDELVEVIAKYDDVKRIFSQIVPARMAAGTRKASEIAFAFFCERVQYAMVGTDKRAILIGDQDDEQVKIMIKDFARYREQGTFWTYSIRIPNIVDTVYFSKSHYSRLVQLADVYLFYITHMYSQSRKGSMADSLRDKLRGKNIYPHRYKEWPTR